MNILSKKCLFLLNLSAGCVILLVIISRFQDTDIFALRVQKFPVRDKVAAQPSPSKKVIISEKIKVPWRFQIEEDGFVFPFKFEKEKYITYDPVNGSWADQILQFENAVIFAYLLKRTLVAPPFIPYEIQDERFLGAYSGEERVPLFSIIDSQILSRKVKVDDLHNLHNQLSTMSKTNICLDSRLGFWLDYIPSVENIQTWRLLRQQDFPYTDINAIRDTARCPETIFGRWTYPKRNKPIYRGILTELTRIKDDVIYFYKDTLAQTFIRIFDKQRTTDLQELLLSYVRFTPAIKSRLKILMNLIGQGYTAILFNSSTENGTDAEAMNQIEKQMRRLESLNLTKTIFITGNVNKTIFLQKFSNLDRRLVFANDFVTENIYVLDGKAHPDKIELFGQLLAVHADYLVTDNMTSNPSFIRHLRTNELFSNDGIAIEDIGARWAKHTTKDSVSRFRKAKLKKMQIEDFYFLQHGKTTAEKNASHTKSNITSSSKGIANGLIDKLEQGSIVKHNSDPSGEVSKTTLVYLKETEKNVGKVNTSVVGKRTKDQLSHMVCLFCNYIRHVTGHHGCPTLKDLC